MAAFGGKASRCTAYVRCSAYETKDSYSDVIVHEAAHLLHYLFLSHLADYGVNTFDLSEEDLTHDLESA